MEHWHLKALVAALSLGAVAAGAQPAATVSTRACSRNLRISVLTVAVFRAAARALSDRLRSEASFLRTSGGMMKQVQDIGVLLPCWSANFGC